MATIIPVTGKSGTKWRATVRKFVDGQLVVNRTRTFLTKKSAETWGRRLEVELDTPEGLARIMGGAKPAATVAALIGNYLRATAFP